METERKQFSLGFCLGFVLLLIAVDQIIKYVVFRVVSSSGTIVSGFGIKPFLNYNFAFSLPLPVVLMYAFYVVAIIVISWYLLTRYKNMDRLTILAWLLIAAGALSNFGERTILGYVKDYIFIFQGIFNLADFYILGAVLFLLIWDQRKLRRQS
jgi:lipoprotein signal peptidase